MTQIYRPDGSKRQARTLARCIVTRRWPCSRYS